MWCPAEISLQFTTDGTDHNILMSHSAHVVPDRVAVSIGDDSGIHPASKVNTVYLCKNSLWEIGMHFSIIAPYISDGGIYLCVTSPYKEL